MLSKALFVGIDEYRPRTEVFGNLGGCVADMMLMKDTLSALLGGLPNDTVILVNQEADTESLLGALEHLTENLSPGEQVFAYYAGHGGQVPNVTRDEADPEEYDQMLVPHDFSKTEPLLDDILNSLFSRVPEGARFTMILDSCHSGGMARAPISSADYDVYRKEGWNPRSIGIIGRASYSPDELERLAEHKKRFLVERSEYGFVLLAAAQPDEYAWERNFGATKHGIFTYHLCEALRTFKSPLSATPIELVNHAYGEIRSYRENQMPRLIGSEDFFRSPLIVG